MNVPKKPSKEDYDVLSHVHAELVPGMPRRDLTEED